MQDNDASMVYKPCLYLPQHILQENLQEMTLILIYWASFQLKVK